MYASNLQELLFHCCEHSSMSPEAVDEFTERFNSLRSQGHLPRGRNQRKSILTPTQVASTILGLVPTRASWAGIGATVLRTLSPVGGPKAGFYEAASLIDAMTLILTDAAARESLTGVRVLLGQTGVNSTGGAVFTYRYEGVRKQAFFMPRMAVSLANQGAETSFDFEGHLFSLGSREMSFGRPFFARIARAMEDASRRPGGPVGEGSEYDEEEAKHALWKSLGVTPHSRFVNLAADNQVTWPGKPTLVTFDGHHFVLMPRTRDNVQSVHIDLEVNRLDASGATTVIRRFLSVMSWCDNQFSTLGFGWSGTPAPVAVPKRCRSPC